jgi:hypothetical protein
VLIFSIFSTNRSAKLVKKGNNILVLPGKGITTLEQLSGILAVDSAELEERLREQGIPLLEYSDGEFLVSLSAISRYLRISQGLNQLPISS